ncbi:amino acid--[acyl-carrier-protein] ligase [Kitasatospora saccharophila]|uniref:Amino acid--[acyl-carrier-protein] ligase n=1 Tax=Kitasatospora saccharophila TaxID=407973 RepID=A0ABN2X8Q8_9ACTN
MNTAQATPNDGRPGTAAPGVPLTTRADARVLDGLRTALGGLLDGPSREHYTAPPVIARRTVELAGYHTSFPQLLGAVHGGHDGEPAPTDLVLTPAACHHLYPLLAAEGGPAGGTLSVEAQCYRGELTTESGRLRSFRMYEFVTVGRPEEVERWRDAALTRAGELLHRLGLSPRTEAANDPFFGRAGRLAANLQHAQQLKWELVVPTSDGIEQAVSSANYHKEHFGEAFGLSDGDGQPAHSACLAFGLDRLVLALRHRYEFDTGRWPQDVRSLLAL